LYAHHEKMIVPKIPLKWYVDFFKDSGNTIKCGQFSKSFKTSQKLTALLFYFSLGKGLISLLVVKKFRYYLDEDTKGVTNVHPK